MSLLRLDIGTPSQRWILLTLVGTAPAWLGQRVEIAGEKVRTSCTGSGPISSSGSALVRSSTVGVLGCPFTPYAGVGNPFAVLVAVSIGVPLHSNVAGVMPLVQAQTSRGSLGIKA